MTVSTVKVAGLWTGRDTNRDEFLVTVYDDGSATIAYRNLAARTWGPERDLERGSMSRQCISCGKAIRGMGVHVFEVDRTNVSTGLRSTSDLMCVDCGANGGNVVRPDG